MMTASGTAVARVGGAVHRFVGHVAAMLLTFPFWMVVLIYARGLKVADEDSFWWERLAITVTASCWLLLGLLIRLVVFG
jgi:hypothetical protein